MKRKIVKVFRTKAQKKNGFFVLCQTYKGKGRKRVKKTRFFIERA